MPEVDPKAWDAFLSQYPQAHLLQTSAWGCLKSAFGWSAVQVIAGQSGAQLLFRRLPLGFSLAYLPKGPSGQAQPELWRAIEIACRRRRAVFLKVEPDAWDTEASKLPVEFQYSPHSIQPRRTLVVDLSGGEEQVLGRMKQKTRYNIGLARRKGVVVRQTSDIASFYRLMEVTGERETFGVHSQDYYQQAYELFAPRGAGVLLLAEFEGQPLAGLMVFARGQRAWYFYGASSDEERNRMPTYLLQWEAMRWARAQGCLSYDLWGVPDADEEVLESRFLERSDGLWGVYRFKRGFGGELRRAAPAYDRIYNPLAYVLYRWWLGRSGMGLQQ